MWERVNKVDSFVQSRLRERENYIQDILPIVNEFNLLLLFDTKFRESKSNRSSNCRELGRKYWGKDKTGSPSVEGNQAYIDYLIIAPSLDGNKFHQYRDIDKKTITRIVPLTQFYFIYRVKFLGKFISGTRPMGCW